MFPVTDHVGRDGDHTAASPLRDTLSQLRLRELLVEVQDRVEQIVKGRDRLDGLVEAMLVVTSGLELDATLKTIVNTAIQLVDAVEFPLKRHTGKLSLTPPLDLWFEP